MTDQTPPAPARRPSRPGFRRGDRFVVVTPIRLASNDMLLPGAELDSRGIPRHRLRSLHRRRRIGPIGHPWTEFMLASFRERERGDRIQPQGGGKFLVVVGGEHKVVDGEAAAEALFRELLEKAAGLNEGDDDGDDDSEGGDEGDADPEGSQSKG